MTKLKQKRKADRLTISKQKKVKYEYLNGFSGSNNTDNYRQRVPSRHQYKRSRNQSVVLADEDSNTYIIKARPLITFQRSKPDLSYNEKSSDVNMLKSTKMIETSDLKIEPLKMETGLQKLLKRHRLSDSDFSTPPLSAKSFQVNPDWSEFEDKENFQFVSDQNIDVFHVMNKFFDFKPLSGMEEPSELPVENDDDVSSTIYNCDNNDTLKWIYELSVLRLDSIPLSIDAMLRKLNHFLKDLLEMKLNDADFGLLKEDFNNIQIQTEAMKYLTHDLSMKDSQKWSELSAKLDEIQSIFEIVNGIIKSKKYFDENIDVLRKQFKHLLIISQNDVNANQYFQLAMEGIRKIGGNMRTEYTKLQSLTGKFFEDLSDVPIVFLDDLDLAINRLEETNNREYKIDLIKLLTIYLQDENISMDDLNFPEPNSHQQNDATLHQILASISQSNLLVRVPIKIIFMVLMSIMCLFSNLDVNNNTNQFNSINNTNDGNVGSQIPFTVAQLQSMLVNFNKQ